jgi:hypothetical protein
MGDADTACQGTPCAWDGFTEKKVLMHGILISHAVALCLYWSKASEHFLWVRCSCMSVKLFHSIEWKCRLRRFRQNFLKDCRRTSRYWHGLRRRGTRFRPWIVLKFISTCWKTAMEQPRIEARLREDFPNSRLFPGSWRATSMPGVMAHGSAWPRRKKMLPY